MPDREKIIKALSICLPETQDDSKLECSDCPYVDVCNPNDIVGITLPLILDIRALLKEQEAKNILDVADSVEGIEVGKCPRCDRTIVSKQSDPTRYCKYCGQAVKWE